MTRPKTVNNTKMGAPQIKPYDNGWRIPKMDGPEAGGLDMMKAFNSTQNRRPPGISNTKGKRESFTDAFAKLSKGNPAVGQYKVQDIDKGLAM